MKKLELLLASEEQQNCYETAPSDSPNVITHTLSVRPCNQPGGPRARRICMTKSKRTVEGRKLMSFDSSSQQVVARAPLETYLPGS